ncbi:MAG: sodium-dependent transporter [Oleiphilaceae bacterium]|nr:sodium-dependent transporter [Oleiphilaceae bacterium]
MFIPYETALGSWTRRSTFFWAATGATVGLSNLWKFPYLAGENGGGLFVLLYLACLLLVTLPLMLTETAVGRHARHGVVLAVEGLARSDGLPRQWVWLGRLTVLAGFLVLSFTAVIGAICLAYVFYAAFGLFVGASEAQIAQTLTDLVETSSGHRHFMAWHLGFLGLVLAVSLQGVVHGLERAFRVVVPLFLILLLALFAYSYEFAELQQAADYLLTLRPQEMTWRSFRLALAHAFYTLGLGMGVWVVFGAYMPRITPMKRSVFAVALMDTLIAILGGLVIYALVLRTGTEPPNPGFELVFLALPSGLANTMGSQFVTTALFIAIVLVAWTTALALFEPLVGAFQEWTAAPRSWSVIIIGSAVWCAGLGTLYSFNIWSDLTVASGTVFHWTELIASGLLVPAVSIGLAVLVGWQLRRTRALALIRKAPPAIAAIWIWAVKLILPVVVLYIGGQHALVSLRELCDDLERAEWCAVVSADVSESPEAAYEFLVEEVRMSPGSSEIVTEEQQSDPAQENAPNGKAEASSGQDGTMASDES